MKHIYFVMNCPNIEERIVVFVSFSRKKCNDFIKKYEDRYYNGLFIKLVPIEKRGYY